MTKKMLLINGPNMNMLGIRQPEIYGSDTLVDIEALAQAAAVECGYDLHCFQSNYEGEIIDEIHAAYGLIDGIVINPAAFTHYSYAIADALSAVGIPAIEIHMSDINSREEFRRHSVTRPYCIDQVCGMGKEGYPTAVRRLAAYLEERDHNAE